MEKRKPQSFQQRMLRQLYPFEKAGSWTSSSSIYDVKNWLIGKDPDAGKDWGQEEKGTTEDEMAGWHHRHNVHGFGWTLDFVMDREAWRTVVHGVAKSWTQLSDWIELNWTGVGDGQGGLACCHVWGHKESDVTEWLNWTIPYLIQLVLTVLVNLNEVYLTSKVSWFY